jgi:hypothetical protein
VLWPEIRSEGGALKKFVAIGGNRQDLFWVILPAQ